MGFFSGGEPRCESGVNEKGKRGVEGIFYATVGGKRGARELPLDVRGVRESIGSEEGGNIGLE